MPTSVISQPSPINTIDLRWPPQQFDLVEAGAFEPNGETAWGVPDAVPMWSALVGTGTTTMRTAFGLPTEAVGVVGRWVGAVADVAQRTLTGFPIFPWLPAFPAPVSPATTPRLAPEWARVWRVAFSFIHDSAAATLGDSGVLFVAAAGAVPTWVTSAVGTGAFGIVSNGAAGVDFVRKRGAGTYLNTTLPSFGGPSTNDPWMVEFEIVSAIGTSDATLRLFINGFAVNLPADSDNWGPGTGLPTMAHGPANANKFLMMVQSNNGVAREVEIGNLRCQAGRFRVDGSEVV